MASFVNGMGVGKGVEVLVGVGDGCGVSKGEATSVGGGCTVIFSTDDIDGEGVTVNGESDGHSVAVGIWDGGCAGVVVLGSITLLSSQAVDTATSKNKPQRRLNRLILDVLLIGILLSRKSSCPTFSIAVYTVRPSQVPFGA